MLPDIGWWELVVTAMVAIIVVGPKDLPKLLRVVGKWTARARAMASEFQRGLDEMAREAEVEELREKMRDVGSINPLSDVKNELNDGLAQLAPSRHEERRQQNPDFDLTDGDADIEGRPSSPSPTSSAAP